MNEILVGLSGVEVIGVEDFTGRPLRVHIRKKPPRPLCGGCGGAVWVHNWRKAPAGGYAFFREACAAGLERTPFQVPGSGCSVKTVTEQYPAIAPARALMTARAGQMGHTAVRTRCAGAVRSL